jgi:hypothetical protein
VRSLLEIGGRRLSMLRWSLAGRTTETSLSRPPDVRATKGVRIRYELATPDDREEL